MPTLSAWTVWFTGLSGAGKSTLAALLASHLQKLSLPHHLLDGDEIRRELCCDLGFSRPDRDENVRRIAYVARLLNQHGIIVLVAAISPYRNARQKARESCAAFVEVHVDCSIPALAARDAKGLYKRAFSGELAQFSGVSDPYEPPLSPEIYLNSELQSPRESLQLLISRLRELGCLPEIVSS